MSEILGWTEGKKSLVKDKEGETGPDRSRVMLWMTERERERELW